MTAGRRRRLLSGNWYGPTYSRRVQIVGQLIAQLIVLWR